MGFDDLKNVLVKDLDSIGCSVYVMCIYTVYMYYQLEYLKLDVKCWVLYTSTHSSISIGILFLDEFKDPLLRDLSSMRISFVQQLKLKN